MKNKLEYQADRIEHTLAVHKIPGNVTGGTITPRWVRFQVLPATGVKISKIKALAEELAAALDTSSCRISRTGASIALEIPRDDPQPVRFIPLYEQLTAPNQTPVPPTTAVLGLAENGEPLLIRLPSPDVAHILVAGTTGSGKTVLLQTMITSLAITNTPAQTSLILIDPKHHAFNSFAHLPHLIKPILVDTTEITETFQSLVQRMDDQGVKQAKSPDIVVVIDELTDILMVGGTPLQTAITRLTQRGREAGIHIVAATQKPTSAVLGPLLKANFPVRLVGRVTSTEDARTATGWSGTGAERLTGRGDFLAVAEGRVIRFQAAHITPTEIETILAKLPRPLQPTTNIKPAIELPPPPLQEPKAAPDLHLAHRLTKWKHWPTRHRKDDPTKYVWGFWSKACEFLFSKPLAGTWERRLKRIVSLAEDISTTPTTKETLPPQQNQTESVSISSRSRDQTLLHAEKRATSTTLVKCQTQPALTNREGLLLCIATFELGIIAIMAGAL